MLLTQHLGDAKKVVITDRILKFIKMLVYGKNVQLLEHPKFVCIQERLSKKSKSQGQQYMGLEPPIF